MKRHLPDAILPGSRTRCGLPTDDGYVWMYDPGTQSDVIKEEARDGSGCRACAASFAAFCRVTGRKES